MRRAAVIGRCAPYPARACSAGFSVAPALSPLKAGPPSSAGTADTAGAPHPEALALLAQLGHPGPPAWRHPAPPALPPRLQPPPLAPPQQFVQQLAVQLERQQSGLSGEVQVRQGSLSSNP